MAISPQKPPIYALQWTDTATGETSLCEVEAGVAYEIGSKSVMALAAYHGNKNAEHHGWSSRYRAVPLPFTGEAPDWFQAMSLIVRSVIIHDMRRAGY